LFIRHHGFDQVRPATAGGGDGVLVRVYGCNTEVLIDREADNAVSAALSALGAAPTFHGRFSNGRVEGYLPGAAPLAPPQLRDARISGLIARRLAHLHGLDVKGVGERAPALWGTLQRWVELARRVGFEGDEAKSAALARLNVSVR
jgi:thiamine kinase-like enzyme